MINTKKVVQNEGSVYSGQLGSVCAENPLEKRFKAKIEEGGIISPHYYLNGFNHPQIPVISDAEPTMIRKFHWGLIPAFCQNIKTAQEMMIKTLNAKSETIFALPSFKSSIRQKRCLVLADGFYEWRTIGKLKYPYFIQLKNKEAFAFGGIYNDWVNKDTGEIFNTFSRQSTKLQLLSMFFKHNLYCS